MEQESNHDATLPHSHSYVDRAVCSVSSFDSPASPGGLYISLRSHVSYGRDFLAKDTNGRLYLHLQDVWQRKPETPAQPAEPAEPTETAKSGEAASPAAPAAPATFGFSSDDTSKFRKCRTIALYDRQTDEHRVLRVEDGSSPDSSSPLTVETICEKAGVSEFVARVVSALLSHTNREASSHWEEALQESAFAADLQQCADPPKIPQSGWSCAHCGGSKNLWMNLSTGFIGCGRKVYGIKESGCRDGSEGAGVRHFEEDREHRPLAVKLGTIQPSGADVFSYPEDEMVLDSKLAEHLAHFGIDIQSMSKTEMSVADAQSKLNKDFDWTADNDQTADGAPVCEVGFAGLENLGNTCYMNVVLQLLVRATAIVRPKLLKDDSEFSRAAAALLGPRYHRHRESIKNDLGSGDFEDFAKENPCVVLSPVRLRQLVASRHRLFATLQQQDADEFLRFACELFNLPLEFEIEEQLKRCDTGKVKVSKTEERVLTVAVPRTDADESSLDSKRAKTEPFDFCDFMHQWKDLGKVTTWEGEEGKRQEVECELTRGIKTFPPHLFIQLGRFYVNESWKAVKNNAPVRMPENLDLSEWRAAAVESGAAEEPEEAAADPLLEVLTGMGYAEDVARSALQAVERDHPDRLSAALDRCNCPNEPRGQADKGSLEMLTAMGFSELQATVALLLEKHSVANAADWLLSSGNELEEAELLAILEESRAPQQEEASSSANADGEPRYKLVGFALHRGANAHTGHYVCYVKRGDGRWVLLNDQCCRAVESAPVESGYLYMYAREDVGAWESLIEDAARKL